MAININRGVEDAFYRYKMPKLQAKVEGKGNGIKTVIVNATDIANSLSRKPIYVTKYFGCELGAQVNVDEKNERYIVNGAHDAAKLQNILDGFIKKFVLCQSCGNPETVLSVKNNNDVKTKCKACGASSILSRTHRLTQYIIKNPPKNESSSSSKKSGNAAEAKVNEEEEGASLIPETNDDSDDWGEDISEEAQKKRMEELTTMAQSMAMSSDVDKSSKEKVQIFLNYVKKNRDEGTLMKNAKFIVAEADKLDLDTKAILVLIEGSLKPDSVIEDLKEYASLFQELAKELSSKAKAELSVLAGIVLFIGLHSDTLLPRSPLILKTLYDEDIVSEEVILNWAKPDFKLPSGILSKKIIKQYESLCPSIISKSEVLIKWLEEAEEESTEQEESEEEEDADEQTEDDEEEEEEGGGGGQERDSKNNEAVVNVTKSIKDGANDQASVQLPEEDDLDIDAI